MQDTARLTFVNKKSQSELLELWERNYAGIENQRHIHAFVPPKFQVPNEMELSNFLKYQPYSWLIKRRVEQDIIGYIIFTNLGNLTNNIGFNIGLPYIRNGYATEALTELIHFLRGEGITEAFGYCLQSNKGSIRTMEKCGFENLGATGVVFGGVDQLRLRIRM